MTTRNSPLKVKVSTSERADFSVEESELVLNRFSDLRDADKAQVVSDFRKEVVSQSRNDKREKNLLTQ